MGQRLNIEIRENDTNDCLANAYYHWSAYTGSAAKLLCQILQSNEFEEARRDPSVSNAVRCLLLTGAGFDEEEMVYAKEELPQELCVPFTNRTEGIIAISDEGIDDTREWAEAWAIIYLDTGEVDFDNLLICVGNSEGIFEGYDDYEGSEIYNADIDTMSMNCADLKVILEYLDECRAKDYQLLLKDPYGNLFSPID